METQHFRKFRGKLIIQPSKKSIESIEAKTRDTIRKHRGQAAAALIVALNPIIRGWAEAQKTVQAGASFGRLEKAIFDAVWRWAQRSHPGKSKGWIFRRYFGINPLTPLLFPVTAFPALPAPSHNRCAPGDPAIQSSPLGGKKGESNARHRRPAVLEERGKMLFRSSNTRRRASPMKALLPCLSLLLAANIVRGKENVPDGFVIQDMEPTGGRILRPNGWFYSESHTDESLMWTISREDTDGGKKPYDTGVRIHAFLGVKEAIGESPEAYIRQYFEQKRTAADEIHKTCDPEDQGGFTSVCLEVSEGGYRVLYFMYWSNAQDVAVVSISGAKKEDWSKYAETFKEMSTFELVDAKRFKDPGKKE